MKKLSIVFTMILIVTLLAACAPAPAPVVPTPQTIIQTVVVEGETKVITATPAPTTPPEPTKAPPDKVSVRTNWLYYGSHAIFFYGKDKGYYPEQNIDLEIKQGNGSGNVVKLVANKDSTFGYVSAAAVINQVAQGAPVIAVATIDGTGTEAVLCDPDSGIKTIKDLEGKQILTTAGAGVNAFWPVVVANAGLDETKIKIVNVAEAALTSSYLQKLAPCMLGGLDDKPAEIEANGGKTPLAFPYADFGVAQPGYVIVAHQDTVKNNPDLVKRFVLATLMATKGAQADPDAAVKSMTDVMGGAAFDEKATIQARKVLDVTLSILISPNNTDKVLGWNIEKDFASALDLFKKYKELQTDLTADKFFTNEFVPKTLP